MTKRPAVLVAVSDIFFYAKIREALGSHGYMLERLKSQAELEESLLRSRPLAMILDMNDPRFEAIALVRAVKTHETWHALPILAFANHEEVATWKEAKHAGVDKIVSRNEFSSRLRSLLEELVVGPPVSR